VVDAFGGSSPHGRHQSSISLEHQLSGNCARQWLVMSIRRAIPDIAAIGNVPENFVEGSDAAGLPDHP